MEFKFHNLNLWRGGILIDEIIKFIKKENPDIITLQEVHDGKKQSLPKNYRTIEVFKNELNYKNYYYSPAFIEETEKGLINNGNLIISNYPFISTRTTFLEFRYQKRGSGTNSNDYNPKNIKDFLKTPRNLQEVEIRINEKVINVYNLQGVWGLDGKDNSRRLIMVNKIIKRIKNNKRVILGGDFNLDQTTKAVAFIERHLVNVFKNELTTTFNMKRKTRMGYATAVVDMVFVSKNLKIVDHYCPPVDISDHLPLVCIFEIK